MGGCSSALLAPIVANYLLQNYGYKGASLIFAAIILNQCVGAMLYQPVEWHLKPAKGSHTTENKSNEECLSLNRNSSEAQGEEIQLDSLEDVTKSNASSDTATQKNILKKLIKEEKKCGKNKSINNKTKDIFKRVVKATYKNIKSLKYMRVQFIAWASCGLILGYINFQMWIPFILTDAGYSIETAAWCSSISSIGNFAGRIIFALIADRKFFNKRYGCIFGLFLVGSSIIGKLCFSCLFQIII